jgi:hypothetical protein
MEPCEEPAPAGGIVEVQGDLRIVDGDLCGVGEPRVEPARRRV